MQSSSSFDVSLHTDVCSPVLSLKLKRNPVSKDSISGLRTENAASLHSPRTCVLKTPTLWPDFWHLWSDLLSSSQKINAREASSSVLAATPNLLVTYFEAESPYSELLRGPEGREPPTKPLGWTGNRVYPPIPTDVLEAHLLLFCSTVEQVLACYIAVWHPGRKSPVRVGGGVMKKKIIIYTVPSPEDIF